MVEKVFTFWHGELGPLEKMCLKSFLNNEIEIDIFTYTEIENLPKGIRQLDAKLFLPIETFKPYLAQQRITAFSNRFRYRVISETGSCWVDTDMLCNTKIVEDLSNQYLFGFESKKIINNAILKAPRNSELVVSLEKYSEKIGINIKQHGQTGPLALTRKIFEADLDNFISDKERFYPISFFETWKLVDPYYLEYVNECFDNASAIHLWSYIFRIANIDFTKNIPPRSSFLGNMFEKYEELDNTLPEISLEDIRYRLKYIPRGKFGFVRMMLHEAFGRWKKVIQHV